MAEPYEAREIQEGDFLMNGGVPYVYFELRLMSLGEAVETFHKIVEEWRAKYLETLEDVKGKASLEKEVLSLKAQEEIYLDMVEKSEEELALVRKQNRALLDRATREQEVADILNAAKDEVVSLKRSNAALVEDLRKTNERVTRNELGPLVREVKLPRLCDKCGTPSPPAVLYGSADDDGKPLDLCDGCLEGMPDRPREEKAVTS